MPARDDYSLEEIGSWKVNCPDAGVPKVRLSDKSKGFVWAAHDVESFWDSLLSGKDVGTFRIEPSSGADEAPILEDGEQRATTIALGFYDPWDKNADAWEGWQKEGLRRFAPQPQGPRGILWIDIAAPRGGRQDVSYVFRLVTHDEPWGFMRNRNGKLPLKGQQLAWDNFIRVIRCQKEIPENEALPPWASGTTLPLAWSWPWDSVTPMPFALLCELGAINTPEWEEFLLFSIENNPMWQLDCPMPTASSHCWKEKICQLLKHREGEDYERLKKIAKIMPNVLQRRIQIEKEAPHC